MKLTCPHCDHSLEAGPRPAGPSIQCPVCGAAIPNPAPVRPAPSPTARPIKVTPAGQPSKSQRGSDGSSLSGKGSGPAMAGTPPSPKATGPRFHSSPNPTTAYVPPQKPGGTRSAKVVAGLVALIGAGVYFTCVESPQQCWERLFGAPAKNSKPAQAQNQPAVLPMAPPVVKATPEPTPQPTPTPSTDSLAWLREHKPAWPKTVTLSQEVEFPVTLAGKGVGTVKLPAGTKLALVEFNAETIELEYQGGRARVPVAGSNLRDLARLAMEQAASGTATNTPTPTPSSNPAGGLSEAAGSEPTTAPAQSPSPTLQADHSGSWIKMFVRDKAEPVPELANRTIQLTGSAELHLTGTDDPLVNSTVNFLSPDAWLFLDKIPPSKVLSSLADRFQVNDQAADAETNLRVVQYGEGTVVIPQGPGYAAMKLFSGSSLAGASMELKCYTEYGEAQLGAMKAGSFRLKRGYMATIAQNEDGTGISRNYVAQDHDLVVNSLPGELDKSVHFIRIFPWRWTSKKGVAGGIWQDLNVGWYYNWNIGDRSTPDLEYVPIKQKRDWPSLSQDWKLKGSTHLLGYNEPDHKDQSNLSVDEAIAGWPELLRTGLRVGSPAVSDGGLEWLYEFMEKANAAHLRVDFVAVHYYRAVGNPGDPAEAANQLHSFLKAIHDRVKRPIWVTEWNNGANWTHQPKPNREQQKAAIAKMIQMLDKTPFVERYAIYNWVEEVRAVKHKDGSLTPAGEAYRDKVSPISYQQTER